MNEDVVTNKEWLQIIGIVIVVIGVVYVLVRVGYYFL